MTDAMAITDIIKLCDSWSTTVEDLGDKVKWGRYGATVYFDTAQDAMDFIAAVKAETLKE